MVCIRCQKRPAIIFIQRMDNGQMKQEGYCLHCARELHIKPVDDLMKQFGMSDQDLDNMENRMESMMEEMGDANPLSMMMNMANGGEDADPDSMDEDLIPGSNATFPLGFTSSEKKDGDKKADRKNGKKPPKRKFLDTYCENLTRKAREGKLDDIIGRDREIYRTIQLLSRRQKTNPCLIGAAGVGKTEVAKVMAAALDRELVRLQCYEGLDESKALYEWNYQKQLLAIQVDQGREEKETLTRSLFSDEYLLERPLLKSIRSETPVVLLIDEIDKADEEFEAFLLELLSEMQVTVPEIGTIRAKTTPFVILTSNRARPLSEALRRRCAYLHIDYPDMEKELAILRKKLPHVDDRLAAQVALAVQKLRSNEVILKKPSIAETLDWAAALDALG